MDPLILTATLDPDVQERFDRLRREHFPPTRNHLAAHVTLFHKLPGEQRPAVERAVAAAADRGQIDIRVTRVKLLGRGVAFEFGSPELAALRADLAREWQTWLSAQDRGKSDLHVTVQNKVDPAAAQVLHARLAAAFEPETVRGTGLALWHYRGGPWEPADTYPFRS